MLSNPYLVTEVTGRVLDLRETHKYLQRRQQIKKLTLYCRFVLQIFRFPASDFTFIISKDQAIHITIASPISPKVQIQPIQLPHLHSLHPPPHPHPPNPTCPHHLSTPSPMEGQDRALSALGGQ